MTTPLYCHTEDCENEAAMVIRTGFCGNTTIMLCRCCARAFQSGYRCGGKPLIIRPVDGEQNESQDVKFR
jgi:hypothetical protein